MRVRFGSFDEPAILDLLRLQRRTGTFRQAGEIVEYIDAADPRKLPGEIKSLVEEGYASGMLPRDNMYVKESYDLAVKRIAADQTDLASLESDAMKSGASLSTIMAAGDVFLSYDEPEKAEAFYESALQKPGSDTATVLTRLGIAQLDQGKI